MLRSTQKSDPTKHINTLSSRVSIATIGQQVRFFMKLILSKEKLSKPVLSSNRLPQIKIICLYFALLSVSQPNQQHIYIILSILILKTSFIFEGATAELETKIISILQLQSELHIN